MPDGNWADVPNPKGPPTDYEAPWQKDQPPQDTPAAVPPYVKGDPQTTTQKQPGGTKTVTTTEVYRSLTRAGVGAGSAVTEECDKCGEVHLHNLIDSNGNRLQAPPGLKLEHVGADEYGSHSGKLFNQVQVTGKELRRIIEVTYDPKLVNPTIVTKWQSKSINHVDNLRFITWDTPIKAYDCETGWDIEFAAADEGTGLLAGGPLTEIVTAVGSQPTDTITKLAELRDKGLLSDEEFQKKKVELLSRI